MAYNALPEEDFGAHSDSPYSFISQSPFEAHEELLRTLSSASKSRSRAQQPDKMDTPRTVSREGSVLRHPAPDLQSLQGAYISNIERLEQSAERLSSSGSDIGEELRKMKLEQKKADSRRSSILNSHNEEEDNSSPLNRQVSYGYGSHASNSIVGTNNVARSGGFSPAAYFASPRNSVRSGSWSHQSSIKERSVSYGPRLTQVSEPEQEGKPLDSPISTRYVPTSESEPLVNPLRVINDGQFNLDDVEIPHTESAEPEVVKTDEEPRASTDTYRPAAGLFADFDGVHTSPHPQDQPDPEDDVNRRASRPFPPSRPISYMQPTPNEDMVYYPAPVPMMLNLPKRLSKLPSAPHRDRRRSELLGNLPAEARSSAAWLPDTPENAAEGFLQGEDERPIHTKETKRRTMADLPPQLRASMFFDQPAVRQDIAVKGESAMDTLDSILDASAFAPVSAFTDHPIVGHVGAEVYSRSPVKTRASIVPAEMKDPKKRRKSMDLLTKRNSSSNLLEGMKKRNSSLLSLGNFGKSKSAVQQLEDDLDPHEAEAAEIHGEETPLQYDDEGGAGVAEDGAGSHGLEEDAKDQQEQEDEFSGQPTTLLAELQLRKQQQKLRNRTAANAYPNGMHSTLMQLDAVAQIQKQARRQQRTTLAWEDPDAQDGLGTKDDEDVPLGMLFPKGNLDAMEKARRLDENRPLGLIARRDMEDNEPLSHRRARLRGEEAPLHTGSPDKRNSMYTLDPLNFEDDNQTQENDEENETLGQRSRRLKATQIPHQTRPVSGDFASEMMSQLGGLDQPPEDTQSNARATSKTPDLEETLGQRRKRLQAEAKEKIRQASGESNVTAARPPMTNRRSMADILQAHPAAGAGRRTLSNEIQFAPAPKTRNTPWAMNQNMQASLGHMPNMPMASGFGMPNGVYAPGTGFGAGMNGYVAGGGFQPHPLIQKPVEADLRQRDMVDRWRQSVMH
ncbi:hypothetical protein P7C71_g3135, partial [Lecanoromycetidae sp. Uapishka_2]